MAPIETSSSPRRKRKQTFDVKSADLTFEEKIKREDEENESMEDTNINNNNAMMLLNNLKIKPILPLSPESCNESHENDVILKKNVILDAEKIIEHGISLSSHTLKEELVHFVDGLIRDGSHHSQLDSDLQARNQHMCYDYPDYQSSYPTNSQVECYTPHMIDMANTSNSEVAMEAHPMEMAYYADNIAHIVNSEVPMAINSIMAGSVTEQPGQYEAIPYEEYENCSPGRFHHIDDSSKFNGIHSNKRSRKRVSRNELKTSSPISPDYLEDDENEGHMTEGIDLDDAHSLGIKKRNPEKNDEHNAKERVRRARIKRSADVLKELIPGCTIKTDKATVFEHAVNYVAYIKSRVSPKLKDKVDKEFLSKFQRSRVLDEDDDLSV